MRCFLIYNALVLNSVLSPPSAPSAPSQDEVEYIVSEVWVKMRHPISGLHPQSHRYRLRNFPNTFTGHDIVDWLVVNENVRSRYM